jgi:hypothetical protein
VTTSMELLRQGRTDKLWNRYLGYLDLTLDEFMQIQKRKVMEHLAWFHPSELGQKIIGPRLPKTIEEFRETVPLTKYADYAPYLLEKSSKSLPEEAVFWMCTSGRGGEYTLKWAPAFREAWEDAVRRLCVGNVALSASRERGDFRVEEGDTMPYTWAPPPYGFGYMAQAIMDEIPMRILPPENEALQFQFQERIDRALDLAYRDGIDFFFGLSSVLVKIGERFAEQAGGRPKFSRSMLHPKALLRLARGIVRSKLAGRPMYPKDLWTVKGICAGGTDTSIFADRLYKYWGVRPLELYGTSEFTGIAVQTWGRKALTPLPDIVFFEFIPLKEHLRAQEEPGYQPKTVLLDEVKAGETYELVFTSLKITVFTRYRVGDMVRITALEDPEMGLKVPQFVIEGRCDDMIDLAGFTRLTERTIWYAIEKSGVGYEEWMCQKELEGEQPVLHIWLEANHNGDTADDVRQKIHESLKEMDSDYRDLEKMLGYNPLRVSLLSKGTFYRYMLDRQKAGAEAARLKPRHFVHSQDVLDKVLEMDAAGRR